MTEIIPKADGLVCNSVSANFESMTYDGWAEFMPNYLMPVFRMSQAFPFFAGDWLNWGTHRYNDRYSQALDASGMSYARLTTYASVCNRVPAENRVEGCSFEHHRLVASLDPELQRGYLEQALDKGWTASQFKKILDEIFEDPKEPTPPPSQQEYKNRFNRWFRGYASLNSGRAFLPSTVEDMFSAYLAGRDDE